MIDVVLVHLGNSDYLSTAIFALTRFEGVRVTLLGDDANSSLAATCNIRHENLARYKSDAWEKIANSYVHDSTLGLDFERFCFLRFAALLDFVEKNDIHRFIYIDSDIILLNRDILDRMAWALDTKELGCLTPAATFFSAWRTTALAAFVGFLPSYFKLPAGGDRHCDMFALSEFLKLRGPDHVETTLGKDIEAYGPKFYFQDPNFSFSPLIMKFANVWGYKEITKKHYDIGTFIANVSGTYVYRPFSTGPDLRLDFVHLNGDTKFYHSDFGRLIMTTETELQIDPSSPVRLDHKSLS